MRVVGCWHTITIGGIVEGVLAATAVIGTVDVRHLDFL